jgi:hypothetical protein
MDQTKAKAIASGYFKSHPKVDKFFITGDDQAFFTRTDAENHAKGLNEKDVIEVDRKSVEEDGQSDSANANKRDALVKKITAAKASLDSKKGQSTEGMKPSDIKKLQTAIEVAEGNIATLEAQLAEAQKDS